MKKQITTSILIHASKEKVWSILLDFENYPEWNSFFHSISGTPKVGSQLKVQLPGMTFTPKVLTLKPNTEFKWLGHLWIKGLFDGAHKFKLSDAGNGQTLFEHSEEFQGVLVGLFAKSLETGTKANFEKMNRELKARAEQA
jgi:hypothetical protein